MYYIKKFFKLYVIFLVWACQYQTSSDVPSVSLQDTIKKADTSKQIFHTAEDTVEYIFEESKPALNNNQHKGIIINTIQQYCQSLNEKDQKKLCSLFADSVQLYESKQKVSKEIASLSIINVKSKKYPSARYFAQLNEIQFFTQKVVVPINQISDDTNSIIELELSFDNAYNIVSYQEKPFKPNKVPLQKQWEGKFVMELNKQIEAYLEIKNFKANRFEFILELNPVRNCGSLYKGNATLTNLYEAQANHPECPITFQLKPSGAIVVNERANCSLHNITCSFEGYYIRYSLKEFRWQ